MHADARSRTARIGLTVLAAALTGCVAEPDIELVHSVSSGRHGEARAHLQRKLGKPKRAGKGYDRDYLLNRLRLMLVMMADGYVSEYNTVTAEVYEVLTQQGLNRDNTVASVFINEDIKIWKGEPFEQALALHYLCVHWAMLDSWDNARAAIQRSLFHLRDFGVDDAGHRHDTVSLAENAVEERSKDYLDHGYTVVESDFALGYLMTAVANHQLAIANGDDRRRDEADDNYRRAVEERPELDRLVRRLKDERSYNTIFVIDHGRGPQKIGTGPDRAVAGFHPLPAGTDEPVVVTAGGDTQAYPIVCDVNRMAADHMWNNLEDVRLAKSAIGSALFMAGAFTTSYGASRDSEAALIAGLSMMAAGLISRAGAHADTRYCDVVPQGIYVVPAHVADPWDAVTLEVRGATSSTIVLRGLEPPDPGEPARLRYVRLVSSGARPPGWAASGRIHYFNDASVAAVVEDEALNLPYILGGHCVRRPRDAVLDSYQRSGFLEAISLSQLRDLYRLEGIQFDPRDDTGFVGAHVLEGGRSLVGPVAGTAGFARLFGQLHPPYQPRSTEVRALARRIADRQARVASAH